MFPSPYPFILAALAATIVSAAPASGFVPVNDPDITNPAVIFSNVQQDDSTVSQTATALMNSNSDMDNADIASDADSGLSSLQDEQAMISLIFNNLDDAGERGEDQAITNILAANKKALGFYRTVVNNPNLEVATDCGLAIACARNTIVDELTEVVNKFNEVNNGDAGSADFQQTDISSDLSCDTQLEFCFQ
ncbi:hypothetical protein F4804DRAFT_349929 [Jackrogersella minutella]|nr:hypothetical protein F4804DRAFT_349929 [Jackrogersella minutella]